MLSRGNPGEWDYSPAVAQPGFHVGSVVKKNGVYYMYYQGAPDARSDDGPAFRAIGVATSADGINFTKYSGNPIITFSSGKGINEEEEGAEFPVATLDSNGEFLLYWGANVAINQSSVDTQLHLSTSGDGFNFTDQGLVSGIPQNSESWPLGLLRAQGGTSSVNGQWHLWYITDALGGGYKKALAIGDAANSFKAANSAPLVSLRRRTEPILHTNGVVSVFETRDRWFANRIDVMETTVNNLDTFSSPVMTFPLPTDAVFYSEFSVMRDVDAGLWRM
ncbi:MAG: hypothetical protein ACE5KZ_05440, partial [Candidatus Scalinduaceae bacterium]